MHMHKHIRAHTHLTIDVAGFQSRLVKEVLKGVLPRETV